MKAQLVITLAGPLACLNRRRVMPVEILANAERKNVRIIAHGEKERKEIPATIKRLPPAKIASQPVFSFFPEKRQVPQKRRAADQTMLIRFIASSIL
jgi:hypothetical protein